MLLLFFLIVAQGVAGERWLRIKRFHLFLRIYCKYGHIIVIHTYHRGLLFVTHRFFYFVRTLLQCYHQAFTINEIVHNCVILNCISKLENNFINITYRDFLQKNTKLTIKCNIYNFL